MNNIKFDIRYSFHLETMHATLCNRIDRMLTFSQLVLGSSVFANVEHAAIIGALMAVLAALSFVYQFGASAMKAGIQAKNYKAMLYSDDSEDELKARFVACQDNDSDAFGVLRNAAHIRASIACEIADSYRLSSFEKFAAWLAGDLPVIPALADSYKVSTD